MNGPAESWSETETRLELKAVIPQPDLYRVRGWLDLHPLAFRRRHPSRRVNNIYFDTVDLNSYVENLDGDSQRAKVRLRWYGARNSAVETGVFEVKLKRNIYGHKLVQWLSGLYDLNGVSWGQLVTGLRAELVSIMRTYLDAASTPVLINSYDREYFSAFDDIARVTLDYNILAFDQRRSMMPNTTASLPTPHTAVVEVKISRQYDQRLPDILGGFPARFSRSSKYVDAVESSFSY